MNHGETRQCGAADRRLRVLACVGMAGMLLAGCASAGGTSDLISGAAVESSAPEAGAVESAALPVAAETPAPATARTGLSRAAPAPKGREKTPEPEYPTFGAPAQIGDRPVMTKEQTEAMQKNLEGLAQQRENQMLRAIEADQ